MSRRTRILVQAARAPAAVQPRLAVRPEMSFDQPFKILAHPANNLVGCPARPKLEVTTWPCAPELHSMLDWLPARGAAEETDD
jgi:hypothetical protein